MAGEKLCITIPPEYRSTVENEHGVTRIYIDGWMDLRDFGSVLIRLGVQAIADARDQEAEALKEGAVT